VYQGINTAPVLVVLSSAVCLSGGVLLDALDAGLVLRPFRDTTAVGLLLEAPLEGTADPRLGHILVVVVVVVVVVRKGRKRLFSLFFLVANSSLGGKEISWPIICCRPSSIFKWLGIRFKPTHHKK